MWGIVVAAGSGSRFGGRKQDALLDGRPLWMWARDALLAGGAAQVVVVGTEDGAPGGERRRDSVAAGLAEVPAETDMIAVHDAARPLAPARLLAALAEALRTEQADGAVPVLPMVDAVKQVRGNLVTATPDRSGLASAQTPQLFQAGALREAHARYPGEAADDAAMVEALGGRVVAVPGERAAFKVTFPEDLRLARTWLEAGR